VHALHFLQRQLDGVVHCRSAGGQRVAGHGPAATPAGHAAACRARCWPAAARWGPGALGAAPRFHMLSSTLITSDSRPCSSRAQAVRSSPDAPLAAPTASKPSHQHLGPSHGQARVAGSMQPPQRVCDSWTDHAA
jgi:hypothetical protein